MKVFSKFLAVLLALVTVLTLIPFSVFAKASDPWLEVEGDEGVDAPVVTVKVDAAALMAWLNDRNASDTVIEQLQSAVEFDLASLREVFSVVELFELIPREEWLSVVPLQDIIEEVGTEQLLTYINLDIFNTIRCICCDVIALERFNCSSVRNDLRHFFCIHLFDFHYR